MSYISYCNSITCNDIIYRTKAEEKALRDSNEVKYSIKMTQKGYTDYKNKNYYRCPNGVPYHGGDFGHRNKEEMLESGMFLLDIDDKDNLKNGKTWKEVWNAFRPHLEEFGVVHFERSIRGGAHITARRTEGLTIRENIRLFNLRFPQFKFDYSCSDISRACFLVPNDYVIYETEDYYTRAVLPYLPLSESDKEKMTGWKEEEQRKHEALMQERQKNAVRFVPKDNSSDQETILQLIEIIENKQIDITSDYNNWIEIGFIIANYFGFAGEELFHRLSKFYPRYDYKETSLKYDNLARTTEGKVRIGTLIMFAQNEGVIK